MKYVATVKSVYSAGLANIRAVSGTRTMSQYENSEHSMGSHHLYSERLLGKLEKNVFPLVRMLTWGTECSCVKARDIQMI